MKRPGLRILLGLTVVAMMLPAVSVPAQTVARRWNDAMLAAIRKDFARPTVHARNLMHVTIAMWDSWATYDATASTILVNEVPPVVGNVELARAETMSYACYRVLRARFADSPGKAISLPMFDDLMTSLGYDKDYTSTLGSTPAALGNRIALHVQHFGLYDNANEQGGYAPNNGYMTVNPPLVVKLPGSSGILDPNRWQPLALDFFVDQGGNPLPISVQGFLGPHWGHLPPFGLADCEMAPGKPGVHIDPGVPAMINGVGDAEYRFAFVENIVMQSRMSPDLPATIDISPGARWNNPLGADDGVGYLENPVTGMPYEPNVVKLGDWSRCIAEFWADGPESETPPGHWNTLANYVTDNLTEKRIGGTGPLVNDLEWDVKMYLALNGAVYDAAVAAWGVKGYYDYVRPISAIRRMCELGQCTDPGLPSYHPDGIILIPGIIEVITPASSAPGERHEELAAHVGEIAVVGWPGEPADTINTYSGVKWLLGVNWVAYQRKTFVTPPFAGYVSGHSTFSRSGAELMTQFTGSAFFPEGLGTYVCPQNDFLVFEDGPSTDVVLMWATYFDASDEASQSRRWGGIHPWIDDYPARVMGSQIGQRAWLRALQYFNGDLPDGVSLPPDCEIVPSPIATRTPFATAIPMASATPTQTPVATSTPSPVPTTTASPTSGGACCPGDADNSGSFVDANDFICVQNVFGQEVTLGGVGDADCSGGLIDGLDFISVQANFGAECP